MGGEPYRQGTVSLLHCKTGREKVQTTSQPLSVFPDFQTSPSVSCKRPVSALLVPVQAGPLSIGKTLPHRVLSLKY